MARALYLWLFVVFCLHVAYSASDAAKAKPLGRFVAKLTHRDAIASRYHNPINTTESAIRDAHISRARFAYLANKWKANISPAFQTDDYRGGLLPDNQGVILLANVSMGDPSVVQFVVLDTGSNYFWVQCDYPCRSCFRQQVRLYDPEASKTYASLACDSHRCFTKKCDYDRLCKYQIAYADGIMSSVGVLATETLTFGTSDDGSKAVPQLLFGCGYSNRGPDGQLSGVLGLGGGNVSLASQLGGKFSYCIGNIQNPRYGFNQLILGDGAFLEGDFTQVEVFRDLYYVTLENVGFKDEPSLGIDSGIFRRTPEGEGGVIVDSGTTKTFLPLSVYEAVKAKVQSLLDHVLNRRNNHHFYPYYDLCYTGDIKKALEEGGFPTLALQFSLGAELVLDAYSLFRQMDVNTVCLNLGEAYLGNLTVIGVYAQQNYNIGYDLVQKIIYFQRIDCQLLDS